MKKILKRVIALVLAISMVSVVYADDMKTYYDYYTIDEILGNKKTLKDCGLMQDKSNIEVCKSASEVINNNIDYGYGFTLLFGNFPQSGISEMSKEPIEWIILEKNNGRALLISKDILFYAPQVFGDTREETYQKLKTYTWGTCDLNKYLNDDFYNKAFSASEKNRIIPYDVTGDKVFILNSAETVSYFNLNNMSYKWEPYYGDFFSVVYLTEGNPFVGCISTTYADNTYNSKQISKYSLSNNKVNWLLRDGYMSNNGFYYIGDSKSKTSGQLNQREKAVARARNGIRPCVWISYDQYVEPAKSQNFKKIGGKVAEWGIGAALDSVLPGSSMILP